MKARVSIRSSEGARALGKGKDETEDGRAFLKEEEGRCVSFKAVRLESDKTEDYSEGVKEDKNVRGEDRNKKDGKDGYDYTSAKAEKS